MSRKSVFTLIVITLFLISCNLVNRALTPQLPSGMQSLETSIPQFVTMMPALTIDPSNIETMIPDLTLIPEISTTMPGIGGLFDPQDPPLREWKGVPILPEATAGYDEGNSYAFKAPVTVEDAVKFYDEKLVELGWSSLFPAQITPTGSLVIYTKGSQSLTVTITASDSSGEILVLFLLT